MGKYIFAIFMCIALFVTNFIYWYNEIFKKK